MQVWWDRRTGEFSERDVAVLTMIAPAVQRLVRDAATQALPASLTARERRTLMLVAAGFSNVEIAHRMDVATVHGPQAPRALLPQARGHQSAGGRGRATRGDAPALRPARAALGTRLRAGRPQKDSRKREWPHQATARTKEKEVPDIFPWGTMHLVRRACAVLTTAALTTALLVAAPPHGCCAPAAARKRLRAGQRRRPVRQMVLTWERIALRTVYTDAASTPIPVGVPVSGSPLWRCTGPSRRRCVARSVLRARRPRRGRLPGAAALLSRPARPSSGPTGPPAWRPCAQGPAKRSGLKIGKRAARRRAGRAGRGPLPGHHHPLRPAARPRGLAARRSRRPTCSAPGSGLCDTWSSASTSRSAGPDALTSSAYSRAVRGGEEPGPRDLDARAPRPRRQTALFFNSNATDDVRRGARSDYLRASPDRPRRVGPPVR